MKARSLAWLFLLWFTVGWMATVRLEAQQTALPPEVLHYADTVLYNGKILTADEKFTVVEAVAVRGGRVLATGPTNRILPMAGPNTRRIDLKGKTVTPGLYDMHMDEFGAAPMWRWVDKFLEGKFVKEMMAVYVNPGWKSKQEAADGIKYGISKVKPGEPVMFPRVNLQVKRESGTAGFICEVFTLEELDALSPNNPVFFISVVNMTVLAENSKAAEVTKRFLPKGVSTPFLKPNNICIGRGNLDVDGVLRPGQWAANDYVLWYEPPDGDIMLPYYREVQQMLNKRGVMLGRGHMAVPTFNGVRALWERGELTVRFRMPFPMVPQISGHAVEIPPEEAETLVRRWANMSKIGDNMLRVTGMRVPAVGGNQDSGNSWTLEPKIRPYADMQGNAAPYGGWPAEQEAMQSGSKETFRGREALIQACRFGWDTATDHTVGDRAYREVVKAYEECRKDQVVHRPTQRLTTGHMPMANPDDIALAAKLGIWSNMSTGHAIGTEIESSLAQYGTERVDKWAPIKSFIKAGIHPSMEGTFWIWNGRSYFQVVSHYITRKDDVYHRVWGAAEALTRQEAIWAGSIWAAEQIGEGDQLATIEPGKEADLLVIDKDYMTIPPDDMEKIQVLLTMVGGKAVYEVSGAL